VRTVTSLEELAREFQNWPHEDCELFVRWSPDVERDLDRQESKDELTGVPLPGLSSNSLTVEPWWERRPLDMWLARRLYDYRHLVEKRGPGTRPWLIAGREVGRGPDNEPLVDVSRVVAVIDQDVIDAAVEMIESLPSDWGSLQRS
jgi:hypothetical protein